LLWQSSLPAQLAPFGCAPTEAQRLATQLPVSQSTPSKHWLPTAAFTQQTWVM
jgi:hypothetical protein